MLKARLKGEVLLTAGKDSIVYVSESQLKALGDLAELLVEERGETVPKNGKARKKSED